MHHLTMPQVIMAGVYLVFTRMGKIGVQAEL